MSSEHLPICFKNVWKKYSRQPSIGKNLKQDIMSFISSKNDKTSLTKDEFWALQDINFTVSSGEVLGLYGPNGAGKSTILKMICKITYPTKGEVTVNGKVATLMGLGAGFHPEFSGAENIIFYGAILGMPLEEIHKKSESIINFAGIREFIDMPVKKYSSGMTMRLAFSIAIHSEADIFLIDEVIAVGDAEFRQKCIEQIKRLKYEGKTLVIVSHSKNRLEKLCSRILYIKKGFIE